MPGGGTTDYAVEIFHAALSKGNYDCFLSADTALPFMYMPDCLEATYGIMMAPSDKIKQVRSISRPQMSLSHVLVWSLPFCLVFGDMICRDRFGGQQSCFGAWSPKAMKLLNSLVIAEQLDHVGTDNIQCDSHELHPCGANRFDPEAYPSF